MRLQAAQTGSAHLEHQFARSGDRIKHKPLLGHDSSTGTVPIVRLFLAALPVVLLGEAKVAQEFGVHLWKGTSAYSETRARDQQRALSEGAVCFAQLVLVPRHGSQGGGKESECGGDGKVRECFGTRPELCTLTHARWLRTASMHGDHARELST